MIKFGLLSVGILVLAACSESEPTATSYKKTISTSAAAATAGTGTTGTGDATALKAQGTSIYNTKCASCHGSITASAKKGKTAAVILAAQTNPSHTGVTPYPTQAECAALEAALK